MRVRKFHRLNEGFGFVEISAPVVIQKKDDYDTIEFTSDEKLSNGEIVVLGDEPFVIRNPKYIKNQSNEYSGEEFASRAKDSIPFGFVALNETIETGVNYLLGNTFGAYFFDDLETLTCTIEGEIWNCDDLFKYLNEEKGYTISFSYDIAENYVYTTVSIYKDELEALELVDGASLRYIVPESQFVDVTGNNYNGAVSNITYANDGSAVFNGSNSIVDTTLQDSQLSNYFSIEAVFKIGNGGRVNYKGLIGTHNTQGITFMQYENGNFRMGLYHSATTVSNPTMDIPSSNIPEGEYCHVVYVYDNGAEKVYLNGNLIATRTQSKYLQGTTVKIGRAYSTGNDRTFLGNVMAVSIYKDKALSNSEIQQNYEVYKSKGLV